MADDPHSHCTLGPSGDGWTHAVCSCGRHLGARPLVTMAAALWMRHKDEVHRAMARQSADVDALPSPPRE